MRRARLGFGSAVAAAAVTVLPASAQTSWPSHPDISVVQSFEPNDPRPEFPPAATVGLKWIGEGDPPIYWKSQRQVNKYGGLDAPGYDAVHSICLGGLPPPPDPLPPDYHYVVSWSGLPGDALEGDGVFHTFIQSSAVDGVFSPDYLVLSNWYWEERVPPLLDPYTLEWHQYWAGTTDVNNTSQIGILVGEYRIVVHYQGTGTQEPDEWPGGGGYPDPEAMRLEVLRTLFAICDPNPTGG